MIDGITYDDFAKDKLRYFAVMKNIEVVGEAAYMLSKEFIIMHPELPWQQIIGMRHVLVHGYATVSSRKLWNTALVENLQMVRMPTSRRDCYTTDSHTISHVSI